MPVCGPNSTYFSTIDECVSVDISSSSSFRDPFAAINTCLGGEITSAFDLERLRFCHRVLGNLTISVYNTDYTGIRDLQTIEGLHLTS